MSNKLQTSYFFIFNDYITWKLHMYISISLCWIILKEEKAVRSTRKKKKLNFFMGVIGWAV